ncbi:hypothetical protein G7B40_007480 [Aetokthonos hydrillicola Thurmond2011]|uniref:Uncharacterized protein n=1 Tax=Aetokthonos hydrillicola Thurmond2011 TaxID=2712845 RepID=A0AAP5I3H5_9CYAN|nr:hypothetical protein [Aetokthonos hydrillicola]MBW4587766.1 hypothetical protein [Aetokthonos hydrillicola CCALA 1050]MDR9894413.1 hypothetical protein [Aetokthonos hydrillicola Thurmond2011]
MATKNAGLQAKTRLLLALWDLGGVNQEVKTGDLTKRIISKGKKVADYKVIFEELEKKGAIAISKKGNSQFIKLVSPDGLEVLGEGLRNPDFRFDGTIVGTWTANALLKWIGDQDEARFNTSEPVNGVKNAIVSYEEFEKVSLKVYEQLNRDYNLNNLVPIYRIRREVGERVNREHFTTWLSGKELAQSNADVLGLPNLSKTNQDREAEALKNIQQILNLVSLYNPSHLCYTQTPT